MSQSNLIICPGIHSSQLTTSFVRGIDDLVQNRKYLILPTERYSPYNPLDITRWLKIHYPSPKNAPSLFFISFSAGVVGSIITATAWQMEGGKVEVFIAFDGWGMPLWGNFPLYRVSHDYFTHWSSRLLGGGIDDFYAAPGVEHLDLWRSPDTCHGWKVDGSNLKTRCVLKEYLNTIFRNYE